MSEREIRARVREALRKLDQRAGRTLRRVVLPSVLGVGLVCGGGGCGERAVQDDAGAELQDGAALHDSGRELAPPPLGAYGVPAADLRVDIDDPQLDYAAPFPEPDSGS